MRGSEIHVTLFGAIIVLVLLGVAAWALGQFPAIDATIKKIIYIIIVVVAVCVGLFFLFELATYFGLTDFNPRMGHHR